MAHAVAPPFVDPGSRGDVAARIVEMLPAHSHYVEPFGGALAVLLAKRPAKLEIVNDLDGDLVAFWRCVRDRPSDLVRACALTPHSRAEFDDARARPRTLDDLERARRVWVCLSQGRSGSRAGSWRRTTQGVAAGSMSALLETFVDGMAAAARRLLDVALECRPAVEVISDYGANRSTLLYVDPPTAGRARRRASDDDQQLAATLKECRGPVVLRSPAADKAVFGELYPGWDCYRLSAASGPSHRETLLWSNRVLQEPGVRDEPLPLDFGAAANTTRW